HAWRRKYVARAGWRTPGFFRCLARGMAAEEPSGPLAMATRRLCAAGAARGPTRYGPRPLRSKALTPDLATFDFDEF
ncbi:MAG TPA: hypothetical protein VFI48_05740, partial [Hyphomicrobiaceae bacterium]|nr:hypothetical protein [Hyphomicrobiaceae bacterium]